MPSEKDEIVEEVRGAFRILGEVRSVNAVSSRNVDGLMNSISRMSVRFAMRAMEYVDFHHMDDDLAEGKLDPRYLPAVRRTVELASPELYPTGLKNLASALKEHMLKLESALVRNDLETARSESHLAHESYHTLQKEASDWLERPGI